MFEVGERAELTAGVTVKELDVTADGVCGVWGGGLFTVEWMEFRLCCSNVTCCLYSPAESKQTFVCTLS
jgi:hypothetical protein